MADAHIYKIKIHNMRGCTYVCSNTCMHTSTAFAVGSEFSRGASWDSGPPSLLKIFFLKKKTAEYPNRIKDASRAISDP